MADRRRVDALMYGRILVPLEHTASDEAILAHVRRLAKLCHASLLLMHVADGWAARNLKNLTLRESEEIRADREYLERCCSELRADGFEAECLLAGGEPAVEIAAAADREGCDLVAMAVHGHKGLQDLIHGTTANKVRHLTVVPVLMVRDLRLVAR